MSDAKVTLADIVNRVPDTYNTNERWVMKKTKLKYVNKIVPFCQLFTRRIRCNILTISLL